jgi:phage FluMu protein Com
MFDPRSSLGMSPPRHVLVTERCSSCDGSVELDCEGISGYAGYQTYNEYLCPHCQKLNHALTFGVILAARAPRTAG